MTQPMTATRKVYRARLRSKLCAARAGLAAAEARYVLVCAARGLCSEHDVSDAMHNEWAAARRDVDVLQELANSLESDLAAS